MKIKKIVKDPFSHLQLHFSQRPKRKRLSSYLYGFVFPPIQLDSYWKSNFPMNPHARLLVVQLWLIRKSAFKNFLKEREFPHPRAYREH